MLEPRKLMPCSIEYCNAPIAVMTEITEKTPMVMPSIVSAERNLFAPSDAAAILMISLNSIVPKPAVTEIGVMEQCQSDFPPVRIAPALHYSQTPIHNEALRLDRDATLSKPAQIPRTSRST